MSTMEVASRAVRSSLNPNAPLFIPAAFQQVEDFSPEWWELVKSISWFRDYWFRQHQEQETFDGDEEVDDDIANLLPDSFDLGIAEDFSHFIESTQSEADTRKSLKSNFDDTEALIKSLSLKSPRNGGVKPAVDSTKYKEKPAQVVSPKLSPRRIIQQPR